MDLTPGAARDGLPGLAGAAGPAGADGSTTANALATTTTSVNVSNAAAPTAGQILKADSGTAASWQDSSSSSILFSVGDYAAVGDGRKYTGGSITAGTSTFTSTDPVFSVSDVNKVIAIRGAGPADLMITDKTLTALITVFVSSTEVTISKIATYTVSNVKFYVGTDNTAAFSAAAFAVPALVTMEPPRGRNMTIEHAPTGIIEVPEGIYMLLEYPDVDNKGIFWRLNTGASVIPMLNLPGRAYFPGLKTGGEAYGIKDHAGGFSVILDDMADVEGGAGVLGIDTPSQLSDYAWRDAVALFVRSVARAPTVTVSSATYSATQLIPSTPLTTDQIRRLRKGMVIDTAHSTKYSGFITAWASDGTSITVSNWWLAGGGAGTPANGYAAYVNVYTKVWAQDSVVALTAAGRATDATGYEFDMYNEVANFNPVTETPNVRGVEMANLGTYQCGSGFQIVGNWYYGFDARSSGFAAFASRHTATYHFWSGSFKVTNAGAVTANSVTASVSITAPVHYAGIATWRSGNGSPEGVVTAEVGSIYSRLDGGAGATLYVKESGTGNTGWIAK